MDNSRRLESAESTTVGKEAMTRRFYTPVRGQERDHAASRAKHDRRVRGRCVADLFAGVGRKFSAEELAHLQDGPRRPVGRGLRGLPAFKHRHLLQRSDRPDVALPGPNAQWWTVAQAYENWISTREPPLFGTEPDARVWALANEAADPATHRVLEIGAGTGATPLPLARRGHPVDVVEMTPKFADIIRSDAERESLDVRIIVA